MGKRELSGRGTWQDYSGANAGVAEKNFFTILQKEFHGTDFRVREKPKEFKNIYKEIALPDEVLAEIYNPGGDYGPISTTGPAL